VVQNIFLSEAILVIAAAAACAAVGICTYSPPLTAQQASDPQPSSQQLAVNCQVAVSGSFCFCHNCTQVFAGCHIACLHWLLLLLLQLWFLMLLLLLVVVVMLLLPCHFAI